jgi:hypothetical protein
VVRCANCHRRRTIAQHVSARGKAGLVQSTSVRE